MNLEESLALLNQGRDAWNAWAQKVIAERAAAEWTINSEPLIADAKAWLDAAQATFSSHTFDKIVDFSGFNFPGEAMFDGATFMGDARFHGAFFMGQARFARVTFTGHARFNATKFTGHARFNATMFTGDAQFDGATFRGDALFHDATFSGQTRFHKAKFMGRAWFHKVTLLHALFSDAAFTGTALFGDATFMNNAFFFGATFTGEARFDGATFADTAMFDGATFKGDAQFQQAAFEKNTEFGCATFEKAANFLAIDGKSRFSLAGATFRVVPDFIQAHFEEAPRFDNSRIEPRRSRWPIQSEIKDRFTGDPDLAARWRALKRLAIQGHDHGKELTFFKGELKARRFGDDKPWGAVFWFGLLYQLFSDFGRSLMRPLLWWLATVVGFACIYLGRHPALAGNPWSGFDWTIKWIFQWLGGAPPLLSCLAGPDKPWLAALGLSLSKGLLFLGQSSTAMINRFHVCLFDYYRDPGSSVANGQLPARFVPKVPYEIIFLSIAQNLISATLIFLFILAIRNHFRIK